MAEGDGAVAPMIPGPMRDPESVRIGTNETDFTGPLLLRCYWSSPNQTASSGLLFEKS